MSDTICERLCKLKWEVQHHIALTSVRYNSRGFKEDKDQEALGRNIASKVITTYAITFHKKNSAETIGEAKWSQLLQHLGQARSCALSCRRGNSKV